MNYKIDFDFMQTNCFWFEPKVLCKQPDGNAVCNLDFCPILKGREIEKDTCTIRNGEWQQMTLMYNPKKKRPSSFLQRLIERIKNESR